MGTSARVVVLGPAVAAAALADQAAARLEVLEARWSRFRPDSEITRLAGANGHPVAVSADTRLLVRSAVDAWSATAGRFDPTVAPALVRLGYDRTFETIGPDPGPLVDGGPDPAPGCAGIEVDDVAGTVRLPAGVRIDPGGLGKGLAADLVAESTIVDGAAGVLVDVGGDVRVTGTAPDQRGWAVAVEDPDRPGAPEALLVVAEGAVVTSSTVRRRWRWDGTTQHHVIDPATGLPARAGLRTVTVVAGSAVGAEVLATAALVAGAVAGPQLLADSGVAALVVPDEGATLRVGPLDRFEVVGAAS